MMSDRQLVIARFWRDRVNVSGAGPLSGDSGQRWECFPNFISYFGIVPQKYVFKPSKTPNEQAFE